MLGPTLWLVVALGVVATVLLDAAAGFGRAGVHAAADHAVSAVLADALADYQNRFATAVAQGGGDAPGPTAYANAVAALPNPLQRSYPPDASGLGFALDYEVAPTTLAAPSCAAGGTSYPDTIGWLQCERSVAESRLSLHLVVRVRDASGLEPLARREQFVSLRLFGEPPYSAVVGVKDAAAAAPAGADALASPPHEGDVGGATVSGASPQPATSAWPAGGTLIHVRYECHDGAGSCANAAPPDPDAALRAGTSWANGNHPQP